MITYINLYFFIQHLTRQTNYFSCAYQFIINFWHICSMGARNFNNVLPVYYAPFFFVFDHCEKSRNPQYYFLYLIASDWDYNTSGVFIHQVMPKQEGVMICLPGNQFLGYLLFLCNLDLPISLNNYDHRSAQFYHRTVVF